MASTRQNAALILIGILAILLSACGGPSPEKITRDFLDALIAGDRATLSSFVEDGLEMANSLTDHETEDNEVFYAILEKISYDIKSSEIDGDTAVVHTVITAPDLPNILTKVMAEALPLAFAAAFAGNDDFTEEVLDQMFLNALTSEDTPMVTTEAAINLIKRDGKWLIAADNDELGNAVTGGAVDYFDKLFGPAEKENEDVEEEEAAYIQLTEYGVGEPITVPSSALTRLFGQPELKGEIVVTIDNYEFTSAIEDAFTFRGTYEPRGTFLVVVYSVTNELNVEIQPSTQISNEVYITDARGRRWEKADYTGDYGGISGSAAVARDHRQPEEFVPPGFTNTTAVVFDLPPNATDGLALVWEEAGIRIPLGAD